MDFTRPGRVDPREIIEPIERFGATNMFGSPALLDRVGRWAEEKNVRLPTLRRVISAGAPAPADVLRRIAGILSNEAQAFTPYGATEALPVCSIGSREILGETAAATRQGAGVCVGQPVGDAKVRIIRICNEPIEIWTDELLVSDGAIGEIVVKGSVVTRWYFNRSESTKLAKINDADGSFYHRMGDLGRIDEQGRVWFCGRKSQRVQTADGDLFTVCCEGIFNAHPKVYRSAIVGVVRSGKNQSVLCVELESGVATRDRETIRRELLELGAKHSTTQSIRRVLFHRRFPTDIRHNAKIGREQLARWAQRRLR
jgi:acyl-coenzyme A synthetase/AMP-(fatty) acid ligase